MWAMVIVDLRLVGPVARVARRQRLHLRDRRGIRRQDRVARAERGDIVPAGAIGDDLLTGLLSRAAREHCPPGASQQCTQELSSIWLHLGSLPGAYTHRTQALPSLSPICVVLFDFRNDPVEFSRGDVGAAMLALAGLRDVQRRAAIAAHGTGQWRALARRRANQRPVLTVRAFPVLRAADQRAGLAADHV